MHTDLLKLYWPSSINTLTCSAPYNGLCEAVVSANCLSNAVVKTVVYMLPKISVLCVKWDDIIVKLM